ncbi:MAG: APC family permease [Haloferacaceae archaeon]
MRQSATPLTDRHLVAVALGSLLGAGILYVPDGVENFAGPVTPLAYLGATVAVCTLAVAYAVFLSSPLAENGGGAYRFLSRTWHSRSVAFLVVWPAVGGYVALVALLAAALGEALAAVVPLSATAGALVVLGVSAAVHGLGPLVAGRVQLGLTGLLVASLLALVVAAASAFDPSNFTPLLPTPALRNAPLASLSTAAAVALFGFVGFDVVVTAVGAADHPRRDGPRALLVGVLGAGLLSTVAAFVTFGVVPWWQLLYAGSPFADAAASALGVDVGRLLGPVATLATASALLALLWPPSRMLAGFGELLPPLARRNRVGAVDLSLGVVVVAAGGIVVVDGLAPALYLAVASLAVQYVGLAATATALPFVRPALYERCRLRPRPLALVVVGVAGVGVAGVFLWRTLTLDPGAVLRWTRWSPALSSGTSDRLISGPMRSVVPAMLAWETLGVAAFVVAADYRDAAGVDLPSMTAADDDAP